ncbi:MAG: ATP-binding cassette domain-containing protein [Acidimicrobiia bacterium]|nr:ATP-binding cassette domain-containing protein [Acidimicrobiia bacterium]
MTKVLLEAKDLKLSYGEVTVVRDLSIHVGRAEVVGLVGANGAGKSTVLKAIAGKPVERGNILLDGADITTLRGHQRVNRGVALVPEGRRLFGPLTVLDNLRLGGYLVSDETTLSERLETVFELFPVLWERREQRADTLSGGEQQMAAVARGLMSGPRLIMLDEMSLGVMPSVVEALYGLVARLVDDGVAVIIADQNLSELLEVVDRAYVMQTGRVVLEGTGAELAKNDEVRRAYLGI